MEVKLNGQTASEINQAKPETATNKNALTEKLDFKDASLKELIAKSRVQAALRHYIDVPDEVTVKKLKKPFENKETKEKTQKIEVMSGTTIEDAVAFELTLLNTELDPIAAVNKKFRIVDCTFALTANMKDGKFSGYAASGLKLMVTKLEEVKQRG